jgi:hypothetical protein
VSAAGIFTDCTEAGSLAQRLDRVQPPRERCRGPGRALNTTVEVSGLMGPPCAMLIILLNSDYAGVESYFGAKDSCALGELAKQQ